MAGNYPIYDPGCVVDSSLTVEKYIGPCDEVELAWDGYPEYCSTIPQGYHIYRTIVPPTSSAVVLCVGIDDEKILKDSSIWENNIIYYSNTSASAPTYTSMTPRGKQSNRNSILFHRSDEEYLSVPAHSLFDLEYADFTIEMWVNHGDRTGGPGTDGTSRPYVHFPCETIAACYDANTGKAIWRVFFETTEAHWSATVGMSGASIKPGGYGQGPNYSGSLEIEFNEKGDGTGATLSETVMPTITNPSLDLSFAGNGLRKGFSHLSIVRSGTNLKVFVDGLLKTSVAYPFEMTGGGGQNITFGRHFGESGRLDPFQFSESYGLSAAVPFAHGKDGDASFFHGQLYDIRIIKGIGLEPPIGGQVDGICFENAWHQTFDKVASLPHTTKKWIDPDPPVDKGAYYRVTAVQCGEDVSCICPNYIVSLKESAQEVNAIAVNTPGELTDVLNSEPPTMLDVFNTWDRSDPSSGTYYPEGTGATGDHGAWYFDSAIDSFVMPNNSSAMCHIIAPQGQWMKTYKHEVVVQSNNPDDDLIGVCGAYTIYNGQHYALNFARLQGGYDGYTGINGNWLCWVQQPGLGANGYWKPGKTIGSYSRNASGGNGWSGKTACIKIERDRNSIRAVTGVHMGSSELSRSDHTMVPESLFEINFALDDPPPGLHSWLPFQGPTGYGFLAQSQANSFYRDWYLHPNPNKRIFDFSAGAPGRVFDWNPSGNRWVLASVSAWEVIGKTATEIYYPDTGKRYNFSCSGELTIT